MSKISLTSDGTIENTILKVDGEKVTDKYKIASLQFIAESPIPGWEDSGYLHCGYRYAEANKDASGYKLVNANIFGDMGDTEVKSIGQKDSIDAFGFGIGQLDPEKEKIIDQILYITPLRERNELRKRTNDSLNDTLLDIKDGLI